MAVPDCACVGSYYGDSLVSQTANSLSFSLDLECGETARMSTGFCVVSASRCILVLSGVKENFAGVFKALA